MDLLILYRQGFDPEQRGKLPNTPKTKPSWAAQKVTKVGPHLSFSARAHHLHLLPFQATESLHGWEQAFHLQRVAARSARIDSGV